MKRPLFVFAGQSNMMGASVYPASEQIYFKNSFEYLHKAKRFGKPMGNFKNYGFPSGEYSYIDLSAAYGEGGNENSVSDLNDYWNNTYFCSSMCNLQSDEDKATYLFAHFSEALPTDSVSLAPYMVKGFEDAGYSCAYAHIAKGGAPIEHYLSGGAADYFDLKVADFFADSRFQFPEDDLSEKVLFWLQGESNANDNCEDHKSKLARFWERAKGLGFTKFCIIRVGFWGNDGIAEVMRAQEEFCKETEDAYMLTRVCSYFEFKEQNAEGWFVSPPSSEFSLCRDSFYGFTNQHVNEKGFKVIAKYAVPNLIRVLFENKEPVLEEELISALI